MCSLFILIQKNTDHVVCNYESSFVKLPKWEIESGFDPESVVVSRPAWVTLQGEIPSPTIPVVSAEEVLKGTVFDINSLPIRDPDCFLSGQIHENVPKWKEILCDEGMGSGEVLQWPQKGVNVYEFFKHFKGNFKGKAYNSDVPPKQYFPNSGTCIPFVKFICSELCERIATGSLKLLGRVGMCVPPKVVMPITIEPSKPRLCHDERFLNLWVKDSPFHLETLRDIPRIVGHNSLMVTCDEKSGYDHVKLTEDSQTYFGIQYGGYFMTYTTIPFGFKASPFIYQTIGMNVTSYLRGLGVLNILYIDDRFVVTEIKRELDEDASLIEGLKLSYVLLELLTRLGYTLSLKKCSLDPSRCKKFLGFFVDSEKQAFILPQDKRLKFSDLREFILSRKEIDLRTLQRFSGKCISMSIAVPGCKLFCSEVNSGISFSVRNSKSVQVSNALRAELEHWRFLDNWSGFVSGGRNFTSALKYQRILRDTDMVL